MGLVAQRAAQLAREQLDWQPPDGGWTLERILHHLASSEVLYTVWFHNPLFEEPLARYVQANRRFYEQAKAALSGSVREGMVFFDDELGIFKPESVVRDTIEMERSVASA